MTEVTTVRPPGITPGEAALIDAGFRPTRHAGLVRLLRRVLWPLMRPFHFHVLQQVDAVRQEVARRPASSSERTDQMLRRLDRLEDGFGIAVDRLDALQPQASLALERVDDLGRVAARVGDIERLLLMQTRLRSELVAITNRHGWLEAQLDQLRGIPSAVELIRDQHAAKLDALGRDVRNAGDTLGSHQDRQDELTRWLKELTSDATSTEGRLGRLEGRQDDLDARTGQAGWSERLSVLEADLWTQTHRQLFLAPTSYGVFVLKAGELISESVRRDGDWDAHILAAAERALTVLRDRPRQMPQVRAVDVGAHFGLLSVAFGRLFDRVTSFEPNVFNATLLRANLVLNGLADRVESRRAALSQHAQMLSLAATNEQEIPLPLDDAGRYAPLDAVNLGAYSFVSAGTGISEAEAYPLDALALDDLGFMKVDVQGADGSVLLGALETIRRCQPWLVFEWEEALSARFGVSFAQVEEQLAGQGYTLRVLHRHNHKQVDYIAVPASEAAALDPLIAQDAA